MIDIEFEKIIKELESIPKIECDKPYDTSRYTDVSAIKVLEEIEHNRNYPWIKEVWERNKNNLDAIAILYRGEKTTYREFFLQAYRYAKALKANGLKKGDEFICCIENTPEFPFIMGAASMVGAKVNLLAADMDKNYLIDIVKKANSPFIFVADKNFVEFAPVLDEVKSYKRSIVIPLDFSLKRPNAYKKIIEQYYKLDENAYNNAVERIGNTELISDFLESGKTYNQPVCEFTGLNDDFTVTYTSGSTLSNRPKGLVHKNRSYITMGRCHDKDVTSVPTMKGRTMLALVRTMSDTDFMSAVSDMFIQGGTVALEPVNDKDFIIESMLINKPTCVLTSRSVWLYTMKRQQNDPRYKNVKFPFLLVPMCIGEGLDANEEKVLNKWLKKMKSGIDITKTPMSVVQMSIAGGDSEHGGIFMTLYRALQSKRISHRGINEPIGMSVYKIVEIKCLRKDGTYCEPMEPGILVANSPCTMHGYVDNPTADQEFWVTDAYGHEWASLNVYGYLDKQNNAYVKGRSNLYNSEIPSYKIAEVILKDTKKILSCEVVAIETDEEIKYVAHIEPQLGTSFNEQKILESALQRCVSVFGKDIIPKLYFRVRNNEESFEMTATLKRSFKALIDEGISEKAIPAQNIELPLKSKKEKIKKLIRIKKN